MTAVFMRVLPVGDANPLPAELESPYVGARETHDEAAEVMRCLRESLCDAAFVGALALLILGEKQ